MGWTSSGHSPKLLNFLRILFIIGLLAFLTWFTYDQVERFRRPNIFYEIERNALSIEIPTLFMLRADQNDDIRHNIVFSPLAHAKLAKELGQGSSLQPMIWNVNFTHSNPFSFWSSIASHDDNDRDLLRIDGFVFMPYQSWVFMSRYDENIAVSNPHKKVEQIGFTSVYIYWKKDDFWDKGANESKYEIDAPILFVFENFTMMEKAKGDTGMFDVASLDVNTQVKTEWYTLTTIKIHKHYSKDINGNLVSNFGIKFEQRPSKISTAQIEIIPMNEPMNATHYWVETRIERIDFNEFDLILNISAAIAACIFIYKLLFGDSKLFPWGIAQLGFRSRIIDRLHPRIRKVEVLDPPNNCSSKVDDFINNGRCSERSSRTAVSSALPMTEIGSTSLDRFSRTLYTSEKVKVQDFTIRDQWLKQMHVLLTQPEPDLDKLRRSMQYASKLPTSICLNDTIGFEHLTTIISSKSIASSKRISTGMNASVAVISDKINSLDLRHRRIWNFCEARTQLQQVYNGLGEEYDAFQLKVESLYFNTKLFDQIPEHVQDDRSK
jgi:hypothetical protein